MVLTAVDNVGSYCAILIFFSVFINNESIKGFKLVYISLKTIYHYKNLSLHAVFNTNIKSRKVYNLAMYKRSVYKVCRRSNFIFSVDSQISNSQLWTLLNWTLVLAVSLLCETTTLKHDWQAPGQALLTYFRQGAWAWSSFWTCGGRFMLRWLID